MDRKMLDKLEELFYNFGETSKHIGRVETDGKAENMKKYDKLCKEREFVLSEFRTLVKQLKTAWQFGDVDQRQSQRIQNASSVGSNPTIPTSVA